MKKKTMIKIILKLIIQFNSLNKKWLSFFIVISILTTNLLIYKASFETVFSNEQKRMGTSGFSHDLAQHFTYFHYYKNLFPLSSLDTNFVFSEEGANNMINNKGEDLIMEFQHWSRLGENARIFAYLPDSIINGSPENPSIRLFNVLIFTLALIICFLGFANINKHLLGVIIVVIVMLTPYYRYEVFQNENVFGLLMSLFLIILGLNVKFLFKKFKAFYYPLILSVVSGILIGTFSEIRGEVAIVLVAAILTYVMSKLNYKNKIILIVLVIVSFSSSKKFIHNYFDYKFQESYALVENNKGHVYDGGRILSHKFWHPVYCGLGDFDEEKGYEWNDKVAYVYAIPFLEKKLGRKVKYTNNFYLDEYYDEDEIYYIKFDELAEYDQVLKDKVLSDIQSDPLWYVEIFFKRILRILSETLPFHQIGWLALPFVAFLFYQKKWGYIKLIVISLPLSFTPLFIYSGGFSTYNSVYSIIVLAIFLMMLLKFVINKIYNFLLH